MKSGNWGERLLSLAISLAVSAWLLSIAWQTIRPVLPVIVFLAVIYVALRWHTRR